ncbi:MAG: signal peptidase I [Eubacteriales bacterium]|jgi:signal peptidase I|nr:signal peptidase I [Eubacteriales bacterium]
MARRELWSWLKTLILAVILALLIREYVLAFYVVDGSSMLPTLHDGQMVAVNKLVYRIGSLRRGDVAVFETQKTLTGSTTERIFIKRIIALPGDTIEIREGKIILNGEELAEDYIDTVMEQDMELLLIEADTVFVMGDNRHPRGSWDSREFGPIPLDSILGRADLIIFPNPHKVK